MYLLDKLGRAEKMVGKAEIVARANEKGIENKFRAAVERFQKVFAVSVF